MNWNISGAALMFVQCPGSWMWVFAYWDVENSSEVKGKVYCPFGKGGASSTTFELIQPQ